MKRIAFYGGSFDPLHIGHLAIARKLSEIFHLEEFYFIPAFHAPHKKDKKVTSAFCRYAMLALATNNDEQIKISTIELEAPERPYTFETQAKLINHYGVEAEIFFVIGADSWNEITTWREWEKVLTQTNIIVVTRPDYEIIFDHITDKIREEIVDLRNDQPETKNQKPKTKNQIYITDSVFIDVSATEIRQKIKDNESGWRELVPEEVAKYVEKYNLYI
ncbi:MAG: nicotinate-nucleotide adenylyltransferase [Pyrinomonadaceae bacterium]